MTVISLDQAVNRKLAKREGFISFASVLYVDVFKTKPLAENSMKRSLELRDRYIMSIEKHLDDLIQDRSDKMLEIEDCARLLFVHPTHLTNTMKEATGTSACGILQLKVMERALRLLADPALSIKDIALILTYEPSQFTKWFKRIAHMTPKQYRRRLSIMDSRQVNPEMVTILKEYADIPLFF